MPHQLMLSAELSRLQTECAFNGAWGGGPRRPQAFYVSSYFWDRATEAGIITDTEAITWQLKASDVTAAGDKACKTHVTDMGSAFPLVNTPCCSAAFVAWVDLLSGGVPASRCGICRCQYNARRCVSLGLCSGRCIGRQGATMIAPLVLQLQI